ncbi:MAG: hypothetical protein IJH90_02345 [Mogibacterium sp.]|nr:hypothetical protein [Mogibacterium sp.]
MVMDASYTGPEKLQAEEVADQAVQNIRKVAEDPRVTMDRLYEAYEKLWMREPTVLDTDDIYPHSYQWRTADRYNAGKLAVLTEAVKTGKRIAETEAYERYVEAGKHRKFKPDTWDV